MSLRHALLGVIKDVSMTGYDLAHHFQGTVGTLWPAPHSQIYPELRSMEADGLVAATVAPRGARGQKRVYAITDAGLAELRRWAAAAMPPPAERDPPHLRAAFFDLAPPASVQEQLRAHKAHYEKRLAQWQERARVIAAREAELVETWLRRQPLDTHARTIALKVFALEGLIERARTEIAWAERGLALCAEFPAQDAHHTTPAPVGEAVEPATAGRRHSSQVERPELVSREGIR